MLLHRRLPWSLLIHSLFLVLFVDPAHADPPDPGRLGRSVVPTFQQVELAVDPDDSGYDGIITTDLDILESTTEVRLHSLGSTIRRITLRDSQGMAGEWNSLGADAEPGAKPSPSLTMQNDESGLLVLSMPRALVTGPGRLVIEFTNEYDTRAEGIYKVETGGESYLFTQLEAVDAREAFPCWDEPAFKIPYQFTITAPVTDLVISNTPAESETAVAMAAGSKDVDNSNWRRIVFRRTPPLPSYLLALAVGPFDTVPMDGLGVPGRIITVRGKAHLAKEVATRTPPMLRALETYFGSPYPFEKLDFLAVPDFWYGGMENAGAIVFAEGVILYEADRVGPRERRRLDATVAHELAHMWFGDLVTMTWWNDLWLNESFATWMAEKITDQLHPEYRRRLGAFEGRQSAMVTDARPNVRAIRKPVDSSVNLIQLADALSYDKGNAMLCMIEGWVGEEPFRDGVVDYLERHAWSNAEAPDLWRALSDASGTDLGPVLSSYLDQPGVPLVQAQRLDGGKVRLTQERYRTAGSEVPETLWNVPVAIRYPTGDGASVVHRVLLEEKELIVQLPTTTTPEWIHPNADETGYYKWEVDLESIERMLERSRQTLRVSERIGLVHNLTSLLEAGRLPGDRYLDMVARCADDDEPEVVAAVLASWESVKSALVVPEVEDAFGLYVKNALAPAMKRFGSAPRDSELPVVSLLRPDLMWWLGHEGKDESVLSAADAATELYLQDPARSDATLAGTMLKLSATRGDMALFDRCRERFETTNDPQDRSRLLTALGSFRDPEVVERALQYALEGPLRPNERTSIPRGLRDAPALRERVFDWMTETYDQMATLIPADRMAYAPEYAGGCSDERLERAREFFADPARQPAGTSVELTKVADRVRACAALRAREGDAVAKYLRG